jgi:hypothetical protein
MSKRSLLARLTGWPMITTKYRAHWRVMIHTHPLILKLLEDNADGDMSKPPSPPKAAPPIMSSSTPTAARPTLSIKSHSMSVYRGPRRRWRSTPMIGPSWYRQLVNGLGLPRPHCRPQAERRVSFAVQRRAYKISGQVYGVD